MLGDGRITKNSSFFTVLEKKGELEVVKKIEHIIDAVDMDGGSYSYWFLFGFKYLSLLKEGVTTDVAQFVNDNKNIKNKFYAENIIGLYWGKPLQQNADITEEIQKGMDKFHEAARDILPLLTLEISGSGIEYLADQATPYDVKNIYGAVRKVIIEGEAHFLPIAPHEKYSFGLVYPWPGTDTAETELLARATKAAENIGFNCVMLSDFGQILDETQHETDEFVKPEDLDYVMTTHYESHKSIDSYYYHLLWNPPDIPLNTGYYEGKVIDNYIMNDDYLIYDFGGMSNHLRSMLMNKPRTLEGASTFVGSFPKSAIMAPNLEEPKLFYCGMNWEKVVDNSNRHSGLFELLDKTGKVKFYGPDVVETWGGIRPWEGYECYQYSIPFDGFSILKEINSCGICLAISSDAHRRAGAVTNRAYEACAAGAVIISDNNIFMEEYFGDSVLYITYNKNNPKDTYNQIMEKYQWIIEHKEEAMEMAKRSQQIFVDKFCMEKGILDVTKKHYERFKVIESDLFAKNDNAVVLAIQVLNTQSEEQVEKMLQPAIDNVRNQYYRNIVLGVVCDKEVKDKVEQVAQKCRINLSIVLAELFDEKGSRNITDGEAVLLAQKCIPHDYFVKTSSLETWFYDHITTLVRTMEDNPSVLASYAGMMSEDKKEFRRPYMFEKLTYSRVYKQEHPKNLPIPGQFLFKKECEAYIPEYIMGSLDGLEYVAYVAMLWIKENLQLDFTKRMTCTWRYEEKVQDSTILDRNRQIRFIRGLVKYDLPSVGLYEPGPEKRKLSELLLLIPVKNIIGLKVWRKLARLTKAEKGIGKAIHKKYIHKLERYNEIIRIIQEG